MSIGEIWRCETGNRTWDKGGPVLKFLITASAAALLFQRIPAAYRTPAAAAVAGTLAAGHTIEILSTWDAGDPPTLKWGVCSVIGGLELAALGTLAVALPQVWRSGYRWQCIGMGAIGALASVKMVTMGSVVAVGAYFEPPSP